MEDTDFCGQGPGPVEETDMNEMMESSHRYFFARKFHTHSSTHITRITALKCSGRIVFGGREEKGLRDKYRNERLVP
ncbi:hypothetical protein SK128_007439 [Halocaridina rubra]|uniref:Uncharacterized protein n=1 Tax=Halocaridina rubra TaxID=373956 RepID=A0AAN8X371_HALRR